MLMLIFSMVYAVLMPCSSEFCYCVESTDHLLYECANYKIGRVNSQKLCL